MGKINQFWKRLNTSGLLWTFVALILMLLVNLIINPQFFAMEMKDGHLYGSLIDILNNGAPLMIRSCLFDQESGFLRLNRPSG